MRRLAVVAASVLVLVGAAAPTASADHTDKLVVFAKVTDVDKQDNGSEGLSKGDEVAFEYDLFSKDHDEVGDGTALCEVTKAHGDDHQFESTCKALFALEDGKMDGKIKTAGDVTGDDLEDGKFVFKITGGTGDFEDAEGKAVIELLHERHHPHAANHDHGKDRPGHGKHLVAKVTFTFT